MPGLTPHKIDIQQGNYVTQEMVSKLKPGMSKSQVRFALGTPLVVDPFHAERWDYVYVQQKRGRTVEQRHIAVIFKDEKLVRIDGDVALAPSAAATGEDAATAKPAPSAAATGETAATTKPAP